MEYTIFGDEATPVIIGGNAEQITVSSSDFGRLADNTKVSEY